jgi:enoyl-CoA hydratase/carnithine racemase
MNYQHLLIDRSHEHIAIVTLNRPDKLNTLNSVLMAEIESIIDEFHSEVEIRVVIFTGSGKLFSGGADLTEKWNHLTILQTMRTLQRGPRLIRKIYDMEQITIAAINGGAFGGGACIASACDFRIADINCMAGFPESKIGMNLSWIALPLVVHLIGPTFAKEMVILGKNNNAETLLKWGFISEITPKEKLIQRAIDIAKEYAAMPPIAAQMIKKSINSIISPLDKAIMHMDSDQWLLTSKSEDFKEAITAFFSKRQGTFKGN